MRWSRCQRPGCANLLAPRAYPLPYCSPSCRRRRHQRPVAFHVESAVVVDFLVYGLGPDEIAERHGLPVAEVPLILSRFHVDSAAEREPDLEKLA